MKIADKIVRAWHAQADEFHYWENLDDDKKLAFAFNYALDIASSRLNKLALNDNSIRHAVNILNDCKAA